MSRIVAAAVAAASFFATSHAAIVANLTQVGDDVQLTLSGSLSDIGAKSLPEPKEFEGAQINTGTGVIGVRVNNGGDFDRYQVDVQSAPASFGDIPNFKRWTNNVSSSTTDTPEGFWFKISNDGARIIVPADYAFGDSIGTVVALYASTTLAEMGFKHGDSYVWTLGSGDLTDTVEFTVMPIPLPALLFASGLIGLARLRRSEGNGLGS
ncbi:MAG: hypothetical protein AAF225_14685 [Pseudomonadota bacterium]